MENLRCSFGELEIATTQFGDDLYTDNPNLTSIYTEPDGTRAWVRGFGGSMSPYDTGGAYGKRGVVFYDDVYNNFYSTHSGLVVGIDTSLTDNIQLGFFGNYGNINLTQFASSDTGGGSWNPNGYGGGVMASYWATTSTCKVLLVPPLSPATTSVRSRSAPSSTRPTPPPKTPPPTWAPCGLVLLSPGAV